MTGALLTGSAAAANTHVVQPQRPTAQSIPFTAAEVTQNDDDTFTLSWDSPRIRHVQVYAGTAKEHISHRRPVARGAGHATVTVRGLGEADRWWFELVPDHGESLTLADRSLHLASAPNFRDAGGYRTTEGRWVRMGVLYRSGALSTLTDADTAKLRRLGIRTVFDLRTPKERATEPDRLPAGTTAVPADVLGDFDPDLSVENPEQAAQLMIQGAEVSVSSDSGRTAYHQLLAAVADKKTADLLYHCTAGKARTGWASAAILTALGVPRDAVMRDYLLSNTYLAATNAAELARLPEEQRPIYEIFLGVRPDYLRAGFDEAVARYGSFDRYLSQGLRLTALDLRHLRKQLLVG
ncbi:tyrosine-protein phosphatase [Streptomyces sp. KL116D]|uniref:tyrosine-protein phosphatase n=1 Tax=Streptomyces sp. KL116D TaxID=3045152 RepID=UPI0035574A1C